MMENYFKVSKNIFKTTLDSLSFKRAYLLYLSLLEMKAIKCTFEEYAQTQNYTVDEIKITDIKEIS